MLISYCKNGTEIDYRMKMELYLAPTVQVPMLKIASYSLASIKFYDCDSNLLVAHNFSVQSLWDWLQAITCMAFSSVVCLFFVKAFFSPLGM